MADIRSSQNIAQVEWQEPGNIKSFQTIAQVEWVEEEAITVKPTWYYEMLRKRNG